MWERKNVSDVSSVRNVMRTEEENVKKEIEERQKELKEKNYM
jgi:hypothetical protein